MTQRRHRSRKTTDTTVTDVATGKPERRVATRRVDFDFKNAELRHFFADGDPAASHLVAQLSALFPGGEDFFVRSVKNHRHLVEDPQLKRDVAGFIGQESVHSREHHEINERFGELGYNTVRAEHITDVGLKFLDKILPRRDRLAVTAALEHYTATFAETLMSDEELRAGLDEPVLNLLLWHALEESEHKAVAFDVFQVAGGSEFQRRWIMAATTVIFVGVVATATTVSMVSDPECRKRPLASLRSLFDLRTSPIMGKKVRRSLRDYYQRGFHPDDHDADDLREMWAEVLFGEEGTLLYTLPA